MLLSLDEAPPDDTALRDAVRSIPEEDNAYAELHALLVRSYVRPDRATVQAEDDWYEPLPMPAAIFSKHLARNQAVFDQLPRILRSRRLQIPMPWVEDGDELLDIKIIGRWLTIRARLRARDHQTSEAFEDCFTALLLGERLEASARGQIEWQVGIGIRGVAAAAFEDVLASSELDDSALADLDRRLEPFLAVGDALPRSRLADYATILSELEMLNRPLDPSALDPKDSDFNKLKALPLSRWYFKPNRSRRLLLELIQGEAKFLEDPSKSPRMKLEDLGGLEKIFSGNALGRDLVRMIQRANVWDLKRLPIKQRLSRLGIDMLRVLIAIRRFQREAGRPPGALSELCPAYLKGVPLDLDGKPLRYRPELEVIYSTGADLVDDSGPGEDPQADGYNEVFSFKRKESS